MGICRCLLLCFSWPLDVAFERRLYLNLRASRHIYPQSIVLPIGADAADLIISGLRYFPFVRWRFLGTRKRNDTAIGWGGTRNTKLKEPQNKRKSSSHSLVPFVMSRSSLPSRSKPGRRKCDAKLRNQASDGSSSAHIVLFKIISARPPKLFSVREYRHG